MCKYCRYRDIGEGTSNSPDGELTLSLWMCIRFRETQSSYPRLSIFWRQTIRSPHLLLGYAYWMNLILFSVSSNLWNDIPPEFINNNSLSIFKSRIHTHYLTLENGSASLLQSHLWCWIPSPTLSSIFTFIIFTIYYTLFSFM